MSELLKMVQKYSGEHRKKLIKVCEPLLDLGINFFWFQFHTKDGHFCCIGNNPDLIYTYIDERMHHHTPFYIEPDFIQEGLYIANEVKNQNFQKNWENIERKFQTKHRISITKRNPQYCSEYGFSTSTKTENSTSLLINQIPLLNKFINYFESSMSKTLHSMFLQPVNIKNEVKISNRKENSSFPYQLDNEKKIKFLEKLDNSEVLKNKFLNLKFTKREIEILHYYSKGLSAREVGEYLNLSRRTVENYISNIKDMFLCNTKSELFNRLDLLHKSNLYPEIFSERGFLLKHL